MHLPLSKLCLKHYRFHFFPDTVCIYVNENKTLIYNTHINETRNAWIVNYSGPMLQMQTLAYKSGLMTAVYKIFIIKIYKRLDNLVKYM